MGTIHDKAPLQQTRSYYIQAVVVTACSLCGSLDVCTYPEAVLLETGVKGEEKSVGVQPSVVLVNQQRVHRDVTAG